MKAKNTIIWLLVLPLATALADPVYVDFGKTGSPVGAGYTKFVAANNATKTISVLTFTLKSRDNDITAGNRTSGDAVMRDMAQTTFNGKAGNYTRIHGG